MGVNYYLPPELEERRKKYLDIPQYKKTGGRNVGQGGPGSLDKFLAKRKREGEAFRHKHEAGVQQMRGDWMGIRDPLKNLGSAALEGLQMKQETENLIREGNIKALKNLIPPPSDRPPTKQQLMRQGMKNIQAEKQKTIEDIAKYRAANPLESDVGPQFVDKSGIKGAGVVHKPKAGDTVEAGDTTEELSDVNEVTAIEKDTAKSKIGEQVQNDGNQSVLTEWTTDQDVNEEATIVPGSEMAVSKEDNKQYQEDIVDKPPETKDPPKAEKKDGPFATAADTVNTLNSMIKGLSTIMANRNPDAKSATFANVDYFKNKMALDDWRKRMYGSQSRA